MIKKYLDQYSLLRLAGYNKIIFVEFYPTLVKIVCLRNKDRFYNIKKGRAESGFDIIASEVCHTSLDNSKVSSSLKQFINKHGLNDLPLIVGINEFKFKSMALPLDVEDPESWFSENLSKVLPEGASSADFRISYEKYNQDESYKYFYFAIVRKDYIQKIHKLLSEVNVHLINISPFPLSLYNSVDYSENNFLYLDFNDSKITYTLVNNISNVHSGEFYLQVDDSYNVLMGEYFHNSISEFYLSLLASSGDRNLEKLNIIICTRKENYSFVENSVIKTFKPATVNNFFNKLDPYFSGSYLAFSKILSDYDSQLNFLEEELIIKERFTIEKALSMRFILAQGVVLLSFLLFAYASEFIVFDNLNNEEESMLTSNSQFANLQSLEKEERVLKSDLAMLLNLKEKKAEYSQLLFDLSKVVNQNTYFQMINSKSAENGLIKLDITGLSHSQQDIASSISTMEKSISFDDVSLSYSSERTGEPGNGQLQWKNKNLLQFNITANYNADKK